MPFFPDNPIEPPAPAASTSEIPDVDVLARLLSDKRLRTGKGAFVLGWLTFSPAVALAGISNLMNGEWGWVAGCALYLVTALKLYHLSRDLDRANVALRVSLDKRWVGALTEALEWPEGRIRAIARQLLTHLLPTLLPEDAALLTEGQRVALTSWLTVGTAVRQPEFALAILKAMETIGEEEAVPYVTRLARQRVSISRLRPIRQAARVCLPVLERRVLAQRLAASPPAATEAATHEHAPERQANAPCEAPDTTRRKQPRPAMRNAFLVASITLLTPGALYLTFDNLRNHHYLIAFLYAILAAVSTQLYRFTLTPQQKQMAHQLASLKELQSIGKLVEALEWPDVPMRRMAARALIEMLPQLRASDSTLLTAEQRAILYRKLTLAHAGAETELLVAILKALEQVGDMAAVPLVEQLAKSKHLTPRQRRVQKAAAECLPYLQTQAMKTQNSQTLLRASSAMDSPAEALLRPAFSNPESDPALLLRASNGDAAE